jgi:hypothetical protein
MTQKKQIPNFFLLQNDKKSLKKITDYTYPLRVGGMFSL